MWLTDVMIILFAGAMLCLILDLGKRYVKIWRRDLAGIVCTGVLGFALADLLFYLRSGIVGPISIRPTDSTFASLYTVDKFGVFVIFTVLAVGTAVSFYSSRYLDPDDNVGPFNSLLLLLLLSLVGVVASGDLLTLFLFWEGMSIAAYGLVAFRKEVAVSLEAALKYLFLAGAGSLVALFGISIIYTLTGSIQLKDLSLVLQNEPHIGIFGLAMLIVGLGVEAAIFPLHTWLPDAYSAAPVPISATLAGIVTGTAVFALIKIVNPAFMNASLLLQVQISHLIQTSQIILAAIAVLTMLIGNLGALGQSNLKRMLSYSSIAHVGYMLAALATFSVFGIVAILFHIWNHGLVKSSFFMLTGNTGKEYENSELSSMKGMFGQNRFLGSMFALSSLGMIGVPPFGTFWSELLIIEALFATESLTFYLVAVVIVLNIALSVGYFSRVITTVARDTHDVEKIEVSWRLTVSPLFLLLLSLATGFAPWLLLRMIS
ncbi:MAG: complex I subunit 5 family protein [Candidatus Bathyarchaeia archaeon]